PASSQATQQGISPDGTPSMPEGPAAFPLKVLPAALRTFCREVALATSTPPDYAALAMLAVAGAAAGNARSLCLKPNSWYEPPLLFAAAVGDRAAGKTPALDLVVKPYEQLQHQLIEQYELEMRAHREAGDEGEAGPEPTRPARLMTTEATSEALHLLLHDHP